jgi:cysteine desulfurase/selenocysteine lyase
VFGRPAGPDRGGVFSLAYNDVHPHDLAQVLDQFGVCVRPGHHCAKPLMRRFNLAATARASFGPYSLTSDTDVLLEALERAWGDGHDPDDAAGIAQSASDPAK